jgi:hypothetical protein
MAKRYHHCRWCGVRIDTFDIDQFAGSQRGFQDELAELIRCHKYGRCPGGKDARDAYRQSLLEQIEAKAAEIGQRASIAEGKPRKQLMALRRKAKLAGAVLKTIGNATARGWMRSTVPSSISDADRAELHEHHGANDA